MWRIGLALLVAATGCNWVFGLHHTQLWDGAPDTPDGPPDAPFQTIVLDWQIPATTAAGVPTMPDYAPITPAPMIQVGPMSGQLAKASYDGTNGTVIVPFALIGHPWRMVYTLPGDNVPHEIQWSVASAHLVVPHLLRPDSPAVPAGSGYSLAPTGAPTLPSATYVMTSGVYTSSSVPNNLRSGAMVTFPFADAFTPLGKLAIGAPESARGDWQLLAARNNITGGFTTYGWAMTHLDLMAGSYTIPATQPAWHSAAATYAAQPTPVPTEARMMSVIGGITGTFGNGEVLYGIPPTDAIVPLVPPGPQLSPLVSGGFGQDVPLLLPLFRGDDAHASTTLADPSTTVGFPPELFSEIDYTRTVGSMSISCTMQTVTEDVTAIVTYLAPIATKVYLGQLNLTTGNEPLPPIPATNNPIQLQWSPDMGNADDFIVRLYDTTSGSLMPVRTYQVLKPVVQIDGSLLQSGHLYMFGITSRKGFPMVALGNADYSQLSLPTQPFSQSTVFPHEIQIQ